jgi:hypothetical protein
VPAASPVGTAGIRRENFRQIPDDRERREPDQKRERLSRAEVTREPRERHVPGKAEQRIDLRDQDEDRHGVLEARHDGRRDVLDERAQSQGAEQRLEQAGRDDEEQHDREHRIGRQLARSRDG